MFIRVYVPRCLYNLTLQLVQRAIKCICWKGHCLEDWTCFTALVENYIKLCPSDRSPSEGKTACQIMWWVITRTWTRVCFRRFREQIRGCKPNSAPPPPFFLSWNQQLMWSVSETPKPHQVCYNHKKPGIFQCSVSIHHCLYSCLHSASAVPAQIAFLDSYCEVC